MSRLCAQSMTSEKNHLRSIDDKPPNDRVEWLPIRALRPFVPSALAGFLRRTTLKYIVTALSLSWPQGA